MSEQFLLCVQRSLALAVVLGVSAVGLNKTLSSTPDFGRDPHQPALQQPLVPSRELASGMVLRERIELEVLTDLVEELASICHDANEEDVPSNRPPPRCKHLRVVEFEDAIKEVDSSRVLSFRRRYNTVRETLTCGDKAAVDAGKAQSIESVGVLEGAVVEYKWNGRIHQYEITQTEPALEPKLKDLVARIAPLAGEELYTRDGPPGKLADTKWDDLGPLFLNAYTDLMSTSLVRADKEDESGASSNGIQLRIPNAWSSLPIDVLIGRVESKLTGTPTSNPQDPDGMNHQLEVRGEITTVCDVAPVLQQKVTGNLPSGAKSTYAHKTIIAEIGTGKCGWKAYSGAAMRVEWNANVGVQEDARLTLEMESVDPQSKFRSTGLHYRCTWAGRLALKLTRGIVVKEDR